MKVYHHANQTFNLSELESAINLITMMQAHDTQEDPDLIEEDDLCPVFREHRRSCYVCRVWSDGHSRIPKADTSLDASISVSDFESVTLSPSTQASFLIGKTVSSTESVTVQSAVPPARVRALPAQQVAAPPVPPTPLVPPAPLVPQVTPQAGSSTSSRWYIVTVGRATGVFQGWHNVHPHVVGVPGACFARHPSRVAAEAAYAQAQASSGGVIEVPV